jgi:hypothetical protein
MAVDSTDESKHTAAELYYLDSEPSILRCWYKHPQSLPNNADCGVERQNESLFRGPGATNGRTKPQASHPLRSPPILVFTDVVTHHLIHPCGRGVLACF